MRSTAQKSVELRRRLGSRILGVAAAIVAVSANMAIAVALWWYADARFGDEKRPERAGAAAAVVFYNDSEPFKSQRLERALALLREGKVDRLLFVGGYRPWRDAVGAEAEARQVRVLIGRDDIAAADGASYDTLSNVAAICPLRAKAAPDRNLILVSETLHLMRIWEERESLGCVDESMLGFTASARSTDPISMWATANKDLAARLVRLVVGDSRYRTLVQRWRYRSF